MLSRTLNRLYRLGWYGAVTLLILAAVLLTLARTLIPTVDRYRAEIEAWAGKQLGSAVTLGGIDARLDGLIPSVILRDVTLRDAVGAPTAHFAEASLGLDLVDSLLRRAPVITEFAVRGASLAVERLPDGRIRVQGMPDSPPAEGAGAGLGAVLLGHGRWRLQDVRVVWRDQRPDTPDLIFEAERIELQNDGDRHRLDARLMLPESVGRELRFAADIEGDPIGGNHWRGSTYLEGSGITPAHWLAEWRPSGIGLVDGRADVVLWADWRQGAVVGMSGRLGLSGLRLAAEGTEFGVESLGFVAEATRTGDGWRVAVDDLALVRGERAFGPARLRLERTGQALDLRADQLPLPELAAALRLLPNLSPEQRRRIAAIDPQGELLRLRIGADESGLVDARCEVAGIALTPVDDVPGIERVDGRVRWHAGRAELALHGRDGRVHLPALFRDPLPFTTLSTRLLVSTEEGGLTLEVPELSLVNADVRAEASVGFQLPAEGVPQLVIGGRFFDAQATAVPRYLPAHIMPPKTVAWLDAAFHAGVVPSGTVRVFGPLDQFPYEKGGGLFQIRFLAEGVRLHYQEGWPDLTSVKGEVLFEGNRMAIEASEGRMFGSRVQQARVGIDDLLFATLRVEGRSDLEGNDPLRLLTETPLKKRFAAFTYPELRFAGDMGLDLHLTIPLETVDPSPVRAGGTIHFKGGSLKLIDRLVAERLTGRLDFDENHLESDRVAGTLLGGPVEVKVLHEGEGNATRNRIVGSGSAEAAELRRFLDTPLLEQVQGQARWDGTLLLPHDRKGGPEDPGVSLQIGSDLAGFASRLPAPLAKAAEEQQPLEISFELAGPRKGQLRLDYAGRVGVLAELAERQGLARGAVRFGGVPKALPEGHELRIEGSLEGVEPAAWMEAMGPSEPPAVGPGKGAARNEPAPIALTIDMERLQLLPHRTEPGQEEAEPEEDPPPRARPPRRIRVQVARLGYGEHELGELRYKAEPRPGVATQELSLKGGVLTLAGRGFSLHDPVVPRTEMSLDLASDDLGRMMQVMGVASVISAGRLAAKGNLVWPGEIGDFALRRVEGGLHLSVREGRIEELQPGAGRLLGLLSLQALPSRLMLDFRDLLESGLRFNVIEGDFKFGAGSAETQNLTMDSNAAVVQISGRTGLARRDYDQLITVVPRVADSLPVAGGLAWGPQVGAALLILQKIFQSQIDSAATTRYKVTGSWEQPSIEKVDQNPTGAEALTSPGQ